ncbi:MAG: hypothetical protein HOA61_08315, partial [Bacteroidetes bacterium]|nr:hypothetical protein [Bacteroidota bacterium]
MNPLKLIQIRPKRKLFYFFILFIISTLQIAQASNIEISNFKKQWNFMPSQAGKIGVKKTVPIAHLTLSINENGSYVYSNTKSKLELKGQWNFIDSTSTLVLKSSSSHVQEFEIIKCNERELVIKNSTHVFVLRSSSISSNLFADYRGILGILVLVFFAFLISNNKKGI